MSHPRDARQSLSNFKASLMQSKCVYLKNQLISECNLSERRLKWQILTSQSLSFRRGTSSLSTETLQTFTRSAFESPFKETTLIEATSLCRSWQVTQTPSRSIQLKWLSIIDAWVQASESQVLAFQASLTLTINLNWSTWRQAIVWNTTSKLCQFSATHSACSSKKYSLQARMISTSWALAGAQTPMYSGSMPKELNQTSSKRMQSHLLPCKVLKRIIHILLVK